MLHSAEPVMHSRLKLAFESPEYFLYQYQLLERYTLQKQCLSLLTLILIANQYRSFIYYLYLHNRRFDLFQDNEEFGLKN